MMWTLLLMVIKNKFNEIQILFKKCLATGSYGNHNQVGLGGLPAIGEAGLASEGESLLYTIPDILTLRDKFASGDRENPR